MRSAALRRHPRRSLDHLALGIVRSAALRRHPRLPLGLDDQQQELDLLVVLVHPDGLVLLEVLVLELVLLAVLVLELELEEVACEGLALGLLLWRPPLSPVGLALVVAV